MRGRRAGVVVGAIVCLAAATARAGDGGVSGEVRGRFSPREAVVRVQRGKITLAGAPRMMGGVAVGVSAFEELRGTLEVKNALEQPVRDVTVELTIFREAGADSGRSLRAAGDDEAGGGAVDGGAPAAFPVPGWKFRYTVDAIAPGAAVALPCRSALPSLDRGDAPTAFAELVFTVEVTGWRAPGLPLARAIALVRHGLPVDQRAAFKGYGEGLGADARATDEAALAQMIGATAKPGEATAQAIPLAFLLAAAQRIGGERTLRELLLDEAGLAEAAPPPAPRVDDDRPPPPNADLVPAEMEGAIHEAVVEVARRNLDVLYAILHDPAAKDVPLDGGAPDGGTRAMEDPMARLVAAARALADDEELDEPASWVEQAADAVEGAAMRQRLIATMGRLGGPEVMPVLATALGGEEDALRRTAAAALSARGEAGLATLMNALDTEDEARHRAPADALLALEGADFEALVRLARDRGVELSGDATGTDIVSALDARYAATRRRDVEALLAESENADPLGPRVEELLTSARSRSPRAFAEARERLARLAARVFRARSDAGRADARALLDEIQALAPAGEPIRDESFRAARRDALIAEASALAPRDLDRALAILDGDGPNRKDPALAAAAGAILLARIDRALEGRDLDSAAELIGRARGRGVAAADLQPRERRLRLLKLILPGSIAGIAIVVAGVAAVPWWRRRRRASSEITPAPDKPQ